jgi:hypothetical protein
LIKYHQSVEAVIFSLWIIYKFKDFLLFQKF